MLLGDRSLKDIHSKLLSISGDVYLEAVPQYAFTLTISMIGAAKRILCLAPQKHKAEVIKTALQGEISPRCPASWLRTQPQATLFLDKDSAALI